MEVLKIEYTSRMWRSIALSLGLLGGVPFTGICQNPVGPAVPSPEKQLEATLTKLTPRELQFVDLAIKSSGATDERTIAKTRSVAEAMLREQNLVGPALPKPKFPKTPKPPVIRVEAIARLLERATSETRAPLVNFIENLNSSPEHAKEALHVLFESGNQHLKEALAPVVNREGKKGPVR